MLIFNRDEYENTYKLSDNEVLQIESNVSLKDFAEILKNVITSGDYSALLNSDHEISLFRSGPVRTVSLNETDERAENPSLYTHTFDAESENGLDNVVSKRATLFEDFERYMYGQNHDFIKVPEDYMDYGLIYKDLLDSLGVMPTLYSHTELSIKKMLDLSYMGRNLFFAWQPLTRSNRMPTYEDLILFDSLSPYEKAAITDTKHSGTHMLDMLSYLRSIPGMENTIISRDMAEAFASFGGNKEEYERQIDEFVKTNILHTNFSENERLASAYKSIEEAFKAEYKRAPKVLPEMYMAYLSRGVSADFQDLKEEMVKGFNLNNIKQIAGFHSGILYLLSPHLNFSEIKKDHLLIFATNLAAGDYGKMVSSGFLNWYQKNKRNVKTSDLSRIIKNMDSLYFDETLSADKLLSQASQARGIINAALVNEQYGIDFRNSIVAIPGRGLKVTDKVNKVSQYILDKDDARVFTVGQDAHCCQNLGIVGDVTYGPYRSGNLSKYLLDKHFRTVDEAYEYIHEHIEEIKREFGNRFITPGAGGSCVANELTNPFVWVTIWEDSVTGETIAQADTHYDIATNTLIYDNIEYVDDGNISRIYDCIATYAENSNFSNIHIGTGYNQHMASVGKRISTKEYINYKDNLTPEYREKFDSHVYSDYSASAVKVKQNDKLFLYPKKGLSSFSIERKPENNEEIAYLLSPVSVIFYDKSIEEKRDLISRFEEKNLTVAELNKIAKANPPLLADFETLPYETQRIMLYPSDENRMNVEMFKYIRHPDSLLMNAAIETTPEAILYFADADYDTWLSVLTKDGSLLEYCPKNYYNEELLLAAINNNPYSIKYAEKDIEEPLRGKLINLAVFKKPILSAHFPDIPEYVWIKICENRGKFIRYNPNPTYRVQKAAVEESPYNIDEIRDPDKRIVKLAAEKIPSLRTNPRYARFFNLSEDYEDTHVNARTYREDENRSFNPNAFSYGNRREENDQYEEFDLEEFA